MEERGSVRGEGKCSHLPNAEGALGKVVGVYTPLTCSQPLQEKPREEELCGETRAGSGFQLLSIDLHEKTERGRSRQGLLETEVLRADGWEPC